MPGHAHRQTGYCFCRFAGNIMSNPFCDRYSHEPNKGELLSKLLVYEFEHITKKGRMCVRMISFSQLSFRDQRCSETPQFVTNTRDIGGLDSAEGHCNLQYSQLYSASFEIINCIDNLFTTIFCSHSMSTNRSPPKTSNMAAPGGLFGSQQRPDDNELEHQIIMLEIHHAKTVNSGNLRINFFHYYQGIVTHLCSHHFQALPGSTTLPHST